jgi:hypothetical protein
LLTAARRFSTSLSARRIFAFRRLDRRASSGEWQLLDLIDGVVGAVGDELQEPEFLLERRQFVRFLTIRFLADFLFECENQALEEMVDWFGGRLFGGLFRSGWLIRW